MTEHTDTKALEDLYNWPATPAAPRRAWYRALWTWIKEDLFAKPFEPIEPISQDEPIRKRLRTYQRGVKLARRLHRLNQDEARETLRVTAMLLGFTKRKQ